MLWRCRGLVGLHGLPPLSFLGLILGIFVYYTVLFPGVGKLSFRDGLVLWESVCRTLSMYECLSVSVVSLLISRPKCTVKKWMSASLDCIAPQSHQVPELAPKPFGTFLWCLKSIN